MFKFHIMKFKQCVYEFNDEFTENIDQEINLKWHGSSI